MKPIVLPLIAAVMLSLSPAAPAASAAPAPHATGDQPVVPSALAARWFSEAGALCEADAGALWGIDLLGPLLLVDPGTREAVASASDAEGVLTESEVAGVWRGRLPDEVGIANTALDWAGRRWTMLMWPLPRDRYDRGRLMCHELFHRIQDRIDVPAASPENPHLDDATGRAWLRLEWRALAEALLRPGPARAEAIRDALLFRACRRQLLPAAAETERQLELNEGLAEYTGLMLSGLPAWTLPDRAAVRLSREEANERLQRSFAYASGPPYGLLLDELDPGWRGRLGPEADLGQLLARAVGFVPPPDAEAGARERLAAYDGDLVLAQEAQRQQRRDERVAELRHLLVAGPVLVLPTGPDLSYSFNPYGAESLPAEGQVFSSLDARDAWGSLAVDGGAVLLQRDETGALVSLRVAAPADPQAVPLAGAGWELRLMEGWRVVAGERAGDYRLERAGG